MDQNHTRLAPEAATDAPASPANSNEPSPDSAFADPPLVSDCLGDVLAGRIAETVEESFPPGSRKPRHDGFTPEKIAAFLHDLAATGVVEHAAAAAGLSVAAAYAFRNRRQGRAFAKMWDAMLVHRARARLASELQGRAIAGCVSVRKRDGEIVGEYHYYDNRLAMALLTRLDRLAERESASEAHLRALSEDLDEFTECLASGGDADAFIEARRPAEPEAAAPPARTALPPDDDPELTAFAHAAGCPDYRDVHARDIPVDDLDPSRQAEWDDDQFVRAYRSGFMIWLEMMADTPGFRPSSGSPLRYAFARRAVRAAAEAGDSRGPNAATDDLDPGRLWDWTDDQLARGWSTGFLRGLPADFWDSLAAGRPCEGAEE
jgi:hypothetical protein